MFRPIIERCPNDCSIPVQEISTQDVMVSGIFYGDYKKKSFVFPAVQQGALTYLSYNEVIKDPRMHAVMQWYAS